MAGRLMRVPVGIFAGAGIVGILGLVSCSPEPGPSTTTTTTTTISPMANVSGVIFTDRFADGGRDSGDAGLSGWTMSAYPSVGGAAEETVPVATATTGADGSFSFTLAAGEYVLCETLPVAVNPLAEWHQSAPGGSACAAIDGAGEAGHAVAAGVLPTIFEFANYQNYGVGYRFGRDADGDGIHDGIAPTPTGQFADLYEDLNVDGTVDAGEPLAYSKAADGAVGGFYAYAGLQNPGIRPGHYVTCQRAFTGATQSAPVNTRCSAVSLLNGGFVLQASSGGGASSDIFLLGPSTRTIAGTVKVDQLAVRVRNASAPVTAALPQAGVTVVAWIDLDHDGIIGVVDDLMQSTVTDATGAFSFSLPTADYVICQVLPAGTGLNEWHQASPVNNVCGGGPGLAPAGHSAPIGSTTAAEFFNYKNYAVSYRIGGDANLDGTNDAVAYPTGWTIDLYADLDADGVVDVGATPAYSKLANGGTSNFLNVASFTNPGILPGTYVACQQSRAGFTQSAPLNTRCGAVSTQAGGFTLYATSGGGSSNNLFLVG